METMTRASLLRSLTVGAKLTMLSHDWYPAGRLIGLEREVVRAKTGAVALATVRPDGTVSESWMDIPRAADVRFNDDGTFSVRLDPDGSAWMTYRLS